MKRFALSIFAPLLFAFSFGSPAHAACTWDNDHWVSDDGHCPTVVQPALSPMTPAPVPVQYINGVPMYRWYGCKPTPAGFCVTGFWLSASPFVYAELPSYYVAPAAGIVVGVCIGCRPHYWPRPWHR